MGLIIGSKDDAIQRLIGTVCLDGKVPVIVRHVKTASVVTVSPLSKSLDVDKGFYQVDYTKPDFNYNIPEIGYVNYFIAKGGAYYCTRPAVRSQRKGINSRSLRFVPCDPVTQPSLKHNVLDENLLLLEGLGKAMEGKYQSLRYLKFHYSVAISKDFAVDNKSRVYFRGSYCANLPRQDSPLMTNTLCLPPQIFGLLQQNFHKDFTRQKEIEVS